MKGHEFEAVIMVWGIVHARRPGGRTKLPTPGSLIVDVWVGAGEARVDTGDSTVGLGCAMAVRAGQWVGLGFPGGGFWPGRSATEMVDQLSSRLKNRICRGIRIFRRTRKW